MNTIQIANILRENRWTRSKFRGVYAADRLIHHAQAPYCCVVNSDKEGEPGTHWLAIYVPSNDTIEYFDSFAEPPNRTIKSFVDKFKHKKLNTKKIQSVFDTSCGSHVIYFLVHRCRGEHFDKIVNGLVENAPFTDSIVKMFVVRLLEDR